MSRNRYRSVTDRQQLDSALADHALLVWQGLEADSDSPADDDVSAQAWRVFRLAVRDYAERLDELADTVGTAEHGEADSE